MSRLAALALAAAAAAAAPPKLILFIMVDDLGWADVGWHRTDNATENATPSLDALVKEGVSLNSHYVYRMCTPSRTSALSGRLPVHVNDRLQNPEEPTCGIPRNMTALGSVMRSGGYSTHVVGKWDVGMATPDHTPEGRGFDSSLIYYGAWVGGRGSCGRVCVCVCVCVCG